MSNEDYFARYLGYDDVGVFKALGRDHDVPMDEHRVSELIARKGQRYESLAAAGEMLFPGAADFIRAAAAAVPIAIASGALTHEIEEVLERAGLRPLFPVIVGADQTERSKPHPDPYNAAFDRLRSHSGRDLIARRTVAIEDSRWGLVSARAAGLRCVAVTNTYSDAELRADAELVVPGLTRLHSTRWMRSVQTDSDVVQAARRPNRGCRRSAGPRPCRAGVPGRAHRVSAP